MILPLDRAAAEVVVSPLHDPAIAPQLGLSLHPLSAQRAALSFGWCYTIVSWDRSAGGGQDAAMLTIPLNVPIGRWRELVACILMPAGVDVAARLEIDGVARDYKEHIYQGAGQRGEMCLPIAGNRLDALHLIFRAKEEKPQQIMLSWIGLSDPALLNQMLESRTEASRTIDRQWSGLVLPPERWPATPRFACGLMFDPDDLPRLRQRKRRPGWTEHIAFLETKAAAALARQPEDDLGEYLPWSDYRFLRVREQGRRPYFWDAQVLAFVGLLNQDAAMIRHALRYLMCMVHTAQWCQSAESRLVGSTWTQRCFLEEMATTSVSLLADWLDFALTDRARGLIRQAIWDKGLAVVEGDMMKCEYLHHMNQGPWFCRARILGGLLLQTTWPRMGNYVERAVDDLRAAMDRYILSDGGTDEGMGYWSLTLHAVLPALIAWARHHKLADVRTLLPKNFAACENFVAVMSGVRPGTTLMDGDQSTDYFVGDTIPILAALFPGSVYSKILQPSLARERPFTYFHHYVLDGLMGFIHGPDHVPPAECVVPTFATLPHVGHLTSLRRGRRDPGRSVRIHLTGCKARPHHSHLNKGEFLLEIDGQPVFIDRGVVRYDDARSQVMRRTYLHNCLTPVFDDGAFADQDIAEKSIIPEGSGNNEALNAEIDLSDVWRSHMGRYRREIRSSSIEEISVHDAGELRRAGQVAFHLHPPWPFCVDVNLTTLAVLEYGKHRFEIRAPWAIRALAMEDLIDYQFRPVYRLTLVSSVLTVFDLETTVVHRLA